MLLDKLLQNEEEFNIYLWLKDAFFQILSDEKYIAAQCGIILVIVWKDEEMIRVNDRTIWP